MLQRHTQFMTKIKSLIKFFKGVAQHSQSSPPSNIHKQQEDIMYLAGPRFMQDSKKIDVCNVSLDLGSRLIQLAHNSQFSFKGDIFVI